MATKTNVTVAPLPIPQDWKELANQFTSYVDAEKKVLQSQQDQFLMIINASRTIGNRPPLIQADTVRAQVGSLMGELFKARGSAFGGRYKAPKAEGKSLGNTIGKFVRAFDLATALGNDAPKVWETAVEKATNGFEIGEADGKAADGALEMKRWDAAGKRVFETALSVVRHQLDGDNAKKAMTSKDIEKFLAGDGSEGDESDGKIKVDTWLNRLNRAIADALADGSHLKDAKIGKERRDTIVKFQTFVRQTAGEMNVKLRVIK